VIRVAVRLFANLADYGPPTGSRGGPTVVELPDGATVAELIRRLALPPDLPRLSLLNGRDAGLETRLCTGDEVSLLPPLVGG
jgi:molybdopterin converting factor small subunit